MGCPRVFERDKETYFQARERGGEMNRAVAMKLGWKILKRTITVSQDQYYRNVESARGMFGVPDVDPGPTPGTHEEQYWVDDKEIEQGTIRGGERWNENEAMHADWQGDLNSAWSLAKEILPEWVNLDAREVAYRICEIFVREKSS